MKLENYRNASKKRPKEVPILWRLARATERQMSCMGTEMLWMWRPKSL